MVDDQFGRSFLMKKIKKPFLIAEIGINHNGSIDITKKLIDEAKKSNFDAVKFQKRDINLVYSKEILDTPRVSQWGTTTREQKMGLEFGEKEYDEINEYCKKTQITWFASPWDINSLKFLDKYNLDYQKVASAMIVDKNLLDEIAKRKKHTFISTGMSTREDIDNAVKIFRAKDCSFELMHCISTYPMKDKDANLSTIDELKKTYQCDVGYSGHESGAVISFSALMFDISSLERHITLDRAMYGSDQAASLEPAGMSFLTGGIEKIISAVGKPSLGEILDEEVPIAKKLRAHIKN
jgi:N-acetylneuraminate synthase